jgi:ceramide glucosyltransferase
MRAELRDAASALTASAALASIGYAAFAMLRLDAFGQRVRARPAAPARGREQPSISVLKPVHGLEPGLEENLRSFCAQDYGSFEVVFGVHDAGDPALEVVRRVVARNPERTRVVIGDGTVPFRNPKIANVAAMLPGTGGEIVVIADSDMRVGAGYLDALAAAFDDPRVGAVTALYRGEAADRGVASVLGAMWIGEQFAPSVLVANAVEPLAYTFGSTMAVRRAVLEQIGGITALGSTLADDHALGARVVRAGYTVALAPYVVSNTVAERDIAALVEHEVRWARTIRSVRPGSYLGIPLTYPLPLALVHFALARNKRIALAIVALAALARYGIHAGAHAALGTRTVPPASAIVLRDALGVVVWLLGLRRGSVRWRDRVLDLERH